MIYIHSLGSLLVSERGKVNRQYIHDQEKLFSSKQWPCLSTSCREIFSVMVILISLGVPGWEIALLMLLRPYLHFHLCSVYLPVLTGSQLVENSGLQEYPNVILLIKCRLWSSVCIFLGNKSVEHKTPEASEDYLDSA